MGKDETTNQNDLALNPFLSARTEEEANRLLAGLFKAELQPVIEKTLRLKFHATLRPDDFSFANQNALEISGAVKSRLISELRKLRISPNGRVIRNLSAYAAQVAVNSYRQHLRTRYPLRLSLKNRLTYLLTHHAKFDLWDERGIRFCGLKRNERRVSAKGSFDREKLKKIIGRYDLSRGASPIDLLEAVFKVAGATPLPFNELLSMVAEAQELKADQAEPVPDVESLPAPREDLPAGLEQREQLCGIWQEICALPVRNRTAFLMNLRDREGDCLIRLFPLLRIASIEEIAAILEFAPEEFALIWNELPWNDQRIADYLDVTRQQVINLRQSVRVRLKRIFTEKDS